MRALVPLLSLSLLLLSTNAWQENEPGVHEVTHFDWLVRENERAAAVSIAGGALKIDLTQDLTQEGELQPDSPDPPDLEKCSVYGLDFWEETLRSKTELCPSIMRFQNSPYFDMVILRNVSVSSITKVVMAKGAGWSAPGGTPEFKDGQLSFEVAGDGCHFPAATPFSASGFLGEVKSVPQKQLEEQCTEWIEDPLFILASFDPANWFHFVERAVIPTFTYYGIAQPYFSTRNTQVATLRWPAKQVFNTRNKEIYPTWNALPEILEKMVGGPLRVVPLNPFSTEKKKGECYRTVAWGMADKLFMNIQNLNRLLEKNGGRGCFSSIVRSSADVLRSVMGVPYVRGPLPTITRLNTSLGVVVNTRTTLPIRVVYMKRSQQETWTRHQGSRSLANQEEVIRYLRKQCEENGLQFEALEFYYKDMKNAQEQIRAIGRATVMIGIHGAGLAGMIALPPGSTVVELRLRSQNLRDNHFVFLAGSMGHKYLQVRYSGPNFTPEQMGTLWDTIARQTQIEDFSRKHKRPEKSSHEVKREERERERERDSIDKLRQKREERRRERLRVLNLDKGRG